MGKKIDALRAAQIDSPLCPVCLHPNSSLAEFCENCNAPLGILSTHGPYEIILSEAWMFRRATSCPPNLLILLGMWLLLGPIVFLDPFIISKLIGDPDNLAALVRESDHLVALLIYDGLPWVLCLVILYQTTKNYIAKKHKIVKQPQIIAPRNTRSYDSKHW